MKYRTAVWVKEQRTPMKESLEYPCTCSTSQFRSPLQHQNSTSQALFRCNKIFSANWNLGFMRSMKTYPIPSVDFMMAHI